MNCSESLFYIVNEDINVRPNIGVKKKIFAQVRVFEKNFFKGRIAYYAHGMAWLLRKGV